jgi:cell division protein FtsB
LLYLTILLNEYFLKNKLIKNEFLEIYGKNSLNRLGYYQYLQLKNKIKSNSLKALTILSIASVIIIHLLFLKSKKKLFYNSTKQDELLEQELIYQKKLNQIDREIAQKQAELSKLQQECLEQDYIKDELLAKLYEKKMTLKKFFFDGPKV